MAKMGRPRAEKPREHTLSFRLKEEEFSQIKDYAERCDMTMTQVIEKAVNEFFENHKGN